MESGLQIEESLFSDQEESPSVETATVDEGEIPESNTLTPMRKRKFMVKGNKVEKPKSRKVAYTESTAYQFLDREADVGDDDGSDEDGSDEGLEYYDGIADLDKGIRDKANWRQQTTKESGMKKSNVLERTVEAIERRYVNAADEAQIEPEDDQDHLVTQIDAAVMPSTSDPKLWTIYTAKKAKGRDLCIAIMNKCLQIVGKGVSIGLTAIYIPDSLKGSIFVEAKHISDIMQLLSDFKDLNLYKTPIMVPLYSVAGVFSSDLQSKTFHFKPGDFIIIKSGLYKGDIGRIYSLNEEMTSAQVKLVPRLMSYQAIGSSQNSLKRAIPKLFSRKEAHQKGISVEPGPLKNTFRAGRDTFDEFGFILQNYRLQSLALVDENKCGLDVLEEKKRFWHQETDFEKQLGETPAPDIFYTWTRGEDLVVIKGDLKGATGQYISADGNISNISLKTDQDKPIQLKIETKHLAKSFNIGDSVQCTKGIHKGKVGLVVSQNKDEIVPLLITISNPITGYEFTTKSIYAQKIPTNSIGQIPTVKTNADGEDDQVYGLANLVRLTWGPIAIITEMHTNKTFTVLTIYNTYVIVEPCQIVSKLSLNPVTIDARSNIIKKGYKVKLLQTEMDDLPLTILHIYGNKLFLQSSGSHSGQAGKVHLADCKEVSLCNVEPEGMRNNQFITDFNQLTRITDASTRESSQFSENERSNRRIEGSNPLPVSKSKPSLKENEFSRPQSRKLPKLGTTIRIIGKCQHKGKLGTIESFDGDKAYVRLLASPSTVLLNLKYLLLSENLDTPSESNLSSQPQTPSKVNIPWAKSGIHVQVTGKGQLFGLLGVLAKEDQEDVNNWHVLFEDQTISIPLNDLRPQKPVRIDSHTAIILNNSTNHGKFGVYKGLVTDSKVEISLGGKIVACDIDKIWKYTDPSSL